MAENDSAAYRHILVNCIYSLARLLQPAQICAALCFYENSPRFAQSSLLAHTCSLSDQMSDLV